MAAAASDPMATRRSRRSASSSAVSRCDRTVGSIEAETLGARSGQLGISMIWFDGFHEPPALLERA